MKLIRAFKILSLVLFVIGLVIAIIDGLTEKLSYYLMGVGFFGFLYTLSMQSREKFEEKFLNDDTKKKN